jgi:hypothetical protein
MISAFSLGTEYSVRKLSSAPEVTQVALPRRNYGHVRGALRTATCAKILKVGVEVGFGEPRLSKTHRLFFASQWNQKTKCQNRVFPPADPHRGGPLTLACARALMSADTFMTSCSHLLFTLRRAPTSGASGVRFDAPMLSRYVSGSDFAKRGERARYRRSPLAEAWR